MLNCNRSLRPFRLCPIFVKIRYAAVVVVRWIVVERSQICRIRHTWHVWVRCAWRCRSGTCLETRPVHRRRRSCHMGVPGNIWRTRIWTGRRAAQQSVNSRPSSIMQQWLYTGSSATRYAHYRWHVYIRTCAR